jgi:beta-phosphoglucomutase-like phosphatase (HAD superfamily)
MPFTAIIFDMDGLMLDTEVLYRSAWQGAARACGFDLSHAGYAELIGLGRHEAEAKLARRFGPSFSVQTFASDWERRWAEQTRSTIPIKAGLIELLDWVDAQRVPFAVATSTDAEYAAACLRKAGLADRIDCLVTGDQVRARKPAPDLFVEAARRLRVRASRCVAVEDSDAGIAAAHAAGMRPIMVPDLKPPSEQSTALAWQICQSLHDVRALLASEWERDERRHARAGR